MRKDKDSLCLLRILFGYEKRLRKNTFGKISLFSLSWCNESYQENRSEFLIYKCGLHLRVKLKMKKIINFRFIYAFDCKVLTFPIADNLSDYLKIRYSLAPGQQFMHYYKCLFKRRIVALKWELSLIFKSYKCYKLNMALILTRHFDPVQYFCSFKN